MYPEFYKTFIVDYYEIYGIRDLFKLPCYYTIYLKFLKHNDKLWNENCSKWINQYLSEIPLEHVTPIFIGKFISINNIIDFISSYSLNNHIISNILLLQNYLNDTNKNKLLEFHFKESKNIIISKPFKTNIYELLHSYFLEKENKNHLQLFEFMNQFLKLYKDLFSEIQSGIKNINVLFSSYNYL